jgi:hypothetical protein
MVSRYVGQVLLLPFCFSSRHITSHGCPGTPVTAAKKFGSVLAISRMWQTCALYMSPYLCNGGSHFEGHVGGHIGLRPRRRSSSDYDAVNRRFCEAELSGYDTYAVTLPMQLSNFLAIDNHSRSAKCFSCLLRSSQTSTRSWLRDCTKYGKHHEHRVIALAVPIGALVHEPGRLNSERLHRPD